MNMSDSAELNAWKFIFQNIPWPGIGDATGLVGSATPGNFYISLHTADPGEAGDQTTSEADYAGYVRVAVARTEAGWTVTGPSPTQAVNAAAVNFPACTGGSSTVTHFAIGKAATGPGEVILSNALEGPLPIVSRIRPEFASGQLAATVD